MIHERLDELHHFRDAVRGANQELRVLQVQELAIDQEGLDVLVGIGAERHPRRLGIADRVVINVRKVDDVPKFVTRVLQVAAKDILKKEGAVVADVREVVNRGSAGVHADGVAFERLELLDLASQRVVKAYGHQCGQFRDPVKRLNSMGCLDAKSRKEQRRGYTT